MGCQVAALHLGFVDRRAVRRAEGEGLPPPDEALRRAQPLPPRERLVIDVPQDEWTAFQEALAEA